MRLGGPLWRLVVGSLLVFVDRTAADQMQLRVYFIDLVFPLHSHVTENITRDMRAYCHVDVKCGSKDTFNLQQCEFVVPF